MTSSTWCLTRTYTAHTDQVWGLEWINEDMIASSSWDRTIQIWSISSGLKNLTINTGCYIYTLQLLNDRIYLAAGLSNSRISFYNINTGVSIKSLTGHKGVVLNLLLIASDFLASSGNIPDNSTRIWNLTTNETKFIFTGHSHSVLGLKMISSDILASGSLDNTVKLWNLTNGTLIRTLENHTKSIGWSVDMLNSETFLSGSFDRTIKVWNFSTGELLRTISTGMGIRVLTVFNATLITSKLPKN